MSITPLNIGSAPNDGNGQDLRSGGQVINDNFAELDTRTNAAQAKADAAQPKEAGKGLSTNDYDAVEKAKVAAAIPNTQKGVASGVATLGGDGKLPVSQLPPLAVNEVFTVANQAAMLALTAERGDAAIRTDQSGQWYILTTDVPTVLANWKPISQNLGVALTALGALTPAADTIAYFSGPATAATTAFTAKARALLARTDSAGMQAELGLVPVTSSSDNTAGRLATVGFGGLGGRLQDRTSTPDAAFSVMSGASFWYAAQGGAYPSGVTDGAMINLSYDIASSFAYQLIGDWRTGYLYRRGRASGVSGQWAKLYDEANAVLDPQTAGGLMSRTVVSGFDVFKYANGQCIAQGPIPTTASVPANTDSSISIAVPSIFNAGNTTLLATLYPSVGNDFSIKNTQAPGSTAFIFIRNGTSAQTFSGNLLLLGRWK